jgi:DNA helicase II / ATP-dependent DNA helicase PcrA
MANFSAQQVYSVISKHQLTAEQLAAVEGASIQSPTLVIAGAGSGKTELMTVRIMYLVANGFATPEQILGLTFTKKAASELSARVLRSLYLMRETDFWPKELDQDFAPPMITTYNSFGNEVFRQNALAVGYEPDAQVLTESGAVALAKELLRSLNLDDLPQLESWEKTSDYLVERLLSVTGELTDNQASAESAEAVLERFIRHVATLPKTEGGSSERFAYTETFLADAQQNLLFLALAKRYQDLKQNRNLVDFSDQVSLALRAVQDGSNLPYRFVMLDEYQDTSSIQTKLLSKLFAGLPVMAVGDPNQAIYGWRGASDANISGFSTDFGSSDTVTLSTCWRSGESIVAAANHISQPLAGLSSLQPIILKSIKGSDPISAEVFQTVEQESEAAAKFFLENTNAETSAALLMRTKSAMPSFVRAMQDIGLEVEVTGLSGLTELPEIIDLIAALKVISSPQAATELMRLLSGPRWAIAPRDIAQLAGYAKKLSRIRNEVDSSRPITLVEALDELRRAGSEDYINVSHASFVRLKSAAELFYRMRTQLSLSITELAWAVVRELNIDIELFAHAKSKSPLGHLEQFISRLTEYEASTIRPTLSGLLQWLDYALEHESFELPKSGSKKGVVQVMSVHAAKGLEWDVVLVAQLNQGSFPIDSKDSKGWLAAGKLPFELRGDRAQLPEFDFQASSSQRDLKQRFEAFQDQMRQRQLREERRLAYVAITRAAKTLRLTASYFKPGAKKARPLSPFLLELIEVGLVNAVTPEPLDSNPALEQSLRGSWPSIERAGLEKLKLAAASVSGFSGFEPVRSQELALLLEERDRAHSRFIPELPKRLSASAMVSLISSPEKFFENLRRPTPVLFSQSATEGTHFHSCIEEYFSASDDAETELTDTEIGANFLGSRFADRKPFAIEQQIEFVLAGVVVVCKLDAVFESEGLYEVVDWKSGKTPDASDLASRSIQLALYRIALSEWLGVGVEQIRVSFFFAADGKEVAPETLLSKLELETKLAEVRRARLS